MKFFQKRGTAIAVMVLAIVAAVAIGRARMPDTSEEARTEVSGSYQYVLDTENVISADTKEYIDAMNHSLFAQTGAQIAVEEIPHVLAVTHQQRLVQIVLGAEVGHLLLGHVVRVQGVNIVAVGGVDCHEDEQRHAEDHRDHQQKPLNNIS